MGKYAIYIVSVLIFSMLTYSSALRKAFFISNSRMVESHSINQVQNIVQCALMVVRDVMANGGDSCFHLDEDEEYSYPYANGFYCWNELHGSYNIRTVNQGDTLLNVQATVRLDDARYMVGLGLTKTPFSSSFPWPAFDSAIHSDENTAITNGNVYGDVFSGGTYSIPGNAHVHGDVYVIPDETGAVTTIVVVSRVVFMPIRLNRLASIIPTVEHPFRETS